MCLRLLLGKQPSCTDLRSSSAEDKLLRRSQSEAGHVNEVLSTLEHLLDELSSIVIAEALLLALVANQIGVSGIQQRCTVSIVQ